MFQRAALLLASLVLLASCSGGPGATFEIASGALKPGEISLPGNSTNLQAQVFDVVNQDQGAEGNTGIAGRVQPMPVDVLSAYAASRFHATGGPYMVRFVIKQASLQVRAASGEKTDFWSFGGGDNKAELTVDVSAMVVASNPDGTGATVSTTTTQSATAPFGSPEENRAAYLQLMGKVIQALDVELTRQVPAYFANVVGR